MTSLESIFSSISQGRQVMLQYTYKHEYKVFFLKYRDRWKLHTHQDVLQTRQSWFHLHSWKPITNLWRTTTPFHSLTRMTYWHQSISIFHYYFIGDSTVGFIRGFSIAPPQEEFCTPSSLYQPSRYVHWQWKGACCVEEYSFYDYYLSIRWIQWNWSFLSVGAERKNHGAGNKNSLPGACRLYS